jgi:ATP-binding cassette, subfamily C, bacterial CydC
MSTLARLLKLIAPFRWWIALAVLLSFLTIGSSVGLMAMSAYLIAKSALITDVSLVAIPVTLVRVFAVLRAAFRYLERLYTHRATFRILTHLRVWFYAAIEPLAPARLMGYRSGDLLARIIGDIETLENFYVRVVAPPLAAVLVTALACLILGAFDLVLALVVLIFLALTGVVLPLATRWISTAPAGALVAGRAGLEATLVDEVQGIADLLSFEQERDHGARVIALSRELNRLQEKMALIRGAGNALAALFTGLAGVTVLGLAIPLVSGGKIEGVFLALLPLTAIAGFEAVQPLALAVQHLEANRAAAGRLFELIREDGPPAPQSWGEPASASAPLPPQSWGERDSAPSPQNWGAGGASIAMRDVRFRYSPEEPFALDGLSLSVPPGGRVVIMGPSGSGKSTIVNLLLRFWDYQEGEIRIDGRTLCDYDLDDLRKLLAVVPQQVHLFNVTIRDNLRLADAQASDEQIVAACRMAQLHDFIQSLPDGYQTLAGENGLLLSGGERQRLAIARAILKNAPIVILDEATANLDAPTGQRLIEDMEPFLQGRTVLIISHRAESWGHIDQVIRLENGRLAGGVG